MRFALVAVMLGLVALVVVACRTPALAPLGAQCAMSAPLDEPASAARVHSHNDYERSRPLRDALDAGAESVEVDVWELFGRLRVSHSGFLSPGSLEELYLAPLAERVRARGSVYGDGRPFTLWIDLKYGGLSMERAIRRALARYPMPPARNGERAPVQIVLTGNDSLKRRLADIALPWVARDSTDLEPASGGAFGHYSLAWDRYVGWDGTGELPKNAGRRLECIVRTAHLQGRKVRFYHAPDAKPVWEVLRRVGADFIGTDRPAELGQYLASAP